MVGTIRLLIALVASTIAVTSASAADCPANRTHDAAMQFLFAPPAATNIREIGLPAAHDIIGRLVGLTQVPPPFKLSDLSGVVAYEFGGKHFLAFFNAAGCLLGATGPGMSRYVAEAVDGTGA